MEHQNTLEEQKENEVLVAIQKRLDRSSTLPKEKSDEDIFGEMVAAELKSLPKRLRHRLKHDINENIFKYQNMMEQERDMVCNQAFLQTPNQSFTFRPTTPSASNNLLISNNDITPTQRNETAPVANPWYTSLTRINELTQ